MSAQALARKTDTEVGTLETGWSRQAGKWGNNEALKQTGKQQLKISLWSENRAAGKSVCRLEVISDDSQKSKAGKSTEDTWCTGEESLGHWLTEMDEESVPARCCYCSACGVIERQRRQVAHKKCGEGWRVISSELPVNSFLWCFRIDAQKNWAEHYFLSAVTIK